MKSIFSKSGQIAVLSCVALLATSAAERTAHATGTGDPYRMIVIVDRAYGQKVHRGSYDDAIARLTAGGGPFRGEEFERQTNLCVAYLKTGELQYAEDACEAAVSHAEERVLRSASRNRFSEYRAAATREAALALSNLGVVHVISGDRENAAKDFESALELNARVPAAKKNLARLIEDEPKTD